MTNYQSNKVVEYENPWFNKNIELTTAKTKIYKSFSIKEYETFGVKSSAKKEIIYHNFTGQYVLVAERNGLTQLIRPSNIEGAALTNSSVVNGINFGDYKRKLNNKFIVEVVECFDRIEERNAYINWLNNQKIIEGDIIHQIRHSCIVEDKGFINGNKGRYNNECFSINYFVVLEEFSGAKSIDALYSNFLNMVFYYIEESDKVRELKMTYSNYNREHLVPSQADKYKGLDLDITFMLNNKNAILTSIQERIEEESYNHAINVYNTFNVENAFPVKFDRLDMLPINASFTPTSIYTGYVTKINLIVEDNMLDRIFFMERNQIKEIPNMKNKYPNLEAGIYIEEYIGNKRIDNNSFISFSNKSLDEITQLLADKGFYLTQQACKNKEVEKKDQEIQDLQSKIKDLNDKITLLKMEEKDQERIHKERMLEFQKQEAILEANFKEQERIFKEKEREQERLFKEREREQNREYEERKREWEKYEKEKDRKEKEKDRKSDFWKRVFGFVKDVVVVVGALFGLIKAFA